MNILIYAHFAGSPEMGMVYGHYYLAREWVRMGHRVTIVTASFAHTRKVNPSVSSFFTFDLIDGIEYVYVRSPAYDPAKNAGRGLNILAFTIGAFFFRPQYEPDLVITSSHHTLTAFTAHRMAKRHRARFVFEIRDLWPLGLVEIAGVSIRHPFIRLLQLGEDFAVRHADRVVSVLSHADGYLRSRGMKPQKFCYVPNGADLTSSPSPLPKDVAAKLKPFRHRHRFLVGYIGGINTANNLEPLIRALPRMVASGVGLVMLGDGPCQKRLAGLVDGLGMHEHCLWLSAIKKPAVASVLSSVDVGYMGLSNLPIYRFGVSPTKVNDYLLSGVPIVFASDAPSDLDGAGPLVGRCPPGDANAIAAKALELCHVGTAALNAGRRQALDWLARNRDYRVLAERFIEGLGGA
ncbi:glycosyltransferase family 4 protein [Motiliproteus sp. SC1-56]|uniref:glycosyltransferase family 4 protein n=1 Tax=Motiliproteus sp. SC1-56 TaxID=2799565 RepID=UPI001A8EC26B|nr:glycosyltransferase family 4 protein [Motiliproteus sp. SC1-56]